MSTRPKSAVTFVSAMTFAAVIPRCVRPTAQPSRGASRAADAGASVAPQRDREVSPMRGQGGRGISMPEGAHPLRREGMARFGAACCVGEAGCTRAACPPAHRLGEVTADGGMPAPVARRMITLNGATLDPCWWGVLARGGSGSATVNVSWTIDGAGHVSGVDARSGPMRNADLEACVSEVIHRWEFPRGIQNQTALQAALIF